MVEQSKIIAMAITLGLMILLPIISGLVLKRWFSIKLSPILTGAGLFFLFSQVFEKLLHTVVLHPDANGVSALQQNAPFLYVLYGAFAAGIFEETARFAGFSLLKKKHHGIGTALAYGIGHGGIEVWLVGLSMFSSLMVSISINTGGSAVASALPKAVLDNLTHISNMTIYASLFERISSLMIQICLSVIVWIAVTQTGKKLFFLLAIILHALVDIGSGLYQTGIVNQPLIIEVLVFAEAVALVYLVVRYFKKNRKELLIV